MDVFLIISSLVLASLVLILSWAVYYAKKSPSTGSGVALKQAEEIEHLQGSKNVGKFEEKDAKSGKAAKKRPVPNVKDNKLFAHPWLVSTLKGHTSQVLDMDFSPSGKYLVTCSEDEEVFCETTASEEKSESSRSSSKTAKLSRRQRRNRVKKVAAPLKAEPKPIALPASIDPLPSRQRLRRATPLKHYSRLRMTDAELYYHLSHYLLTEDHLVNLGFPVESALYPGLAIIYKNPDNHMTFSRGPVGGEVQGRPQGGTEEVKAPHSPSLEKRCMRCEKGFFVTVDGEYLTEERCTYHWGKFNRVDSEYTCCSGAEDSGGCCTAQLHVWNGISSGMNGPYTDYVRARLCKTEQHSVYALDCEMCFTGLGLELSKVTVVSIDGRLVYEALVKPDRVIVDYNTRFSGLNGSYLHRPTKTIREVQNDLMGFIHSGTILIGHGIENDLRVLRLLHNNIVDTAILFPHHFGLPYRRSLKSLVRAYLKRDIQNGAMGHDSYEDARACAELVLWKLHKDLRRRSEYRSLIFWTLKLADVEMSRELSMKDIRTVKAAVEFDYASRVCWSPDSKAVVAVKATANQIEVYKVGRKPNGGGLGNIQLGLTFPKNRDADIIAVGLASTGRYIMSCTDKTEVDIWDLRGQSLNSFTTNQMMTYCAKVSPCGRFVASSGFTPDVKVWEVVFSRAGDFEKVTRAFELTGHTSGIWSFDFTPDSSRMATVSKDGTWRIYDTKIEHQKGQLPYLLLTGRWPQEGKPARISIAPDCRTVAIGTVDNILIYSAVTGELQAEIDHAHAGEINGIRFDATSKFILTTGDRYVRVFRNIPGYRVTMAELEQKLRTANTQALKERVQGQIEEARQVIQLYA